MMLKCVTSLIILWVLMNVNANATQFGDVKYDLSPQEVYAIVSRDFGVELSTSVVYDGETFDSSYALKGTEVRYAFIQLHGLKWLSIYLFRNSKLLKVMLLTTLNVESPESDYIEWIELVDKYESKYGQGGREYVLTSENQYMTDAEWMIYKEWSPQWYLQELDGSWLSIKLTFAEPNSFLSVIYESASFYAYLAEIDEQETTKF